jgi:hypothetical protein
MVAVLPPAAWLVLVPIILIESGYDRWRYKFPFGRSLAAQSILMVRGNEQCAL